MAGAYRSTTLRCHHSWSRVISFSSFSKGQHSSSPSPAPINHPSLLASDNPPSKIYKWKLYDSLLKLSVAP